MVKKHRTIKSKHQERLSLGLIIGITVILLLIVGSLFFVFSRQKNSIDYELYNGFTFKKLDKNTWQTTVEMNKQLYDIPFYNNPHDIKGIDYDDNVTLHLLDLINTIKPKRRILLAIHPEAGSVPVLAGVNIARITGKFYGANTTGVLYLDDNESDMYSNTNLPHVNCDDANFLTTVIKISPFENTTSVGFIDNNTNCILVGADSKENLLMAADEVGYKLLGIMK